MLERRRRSDLSGCCIVIVFFFITLFFVVHNKMTMTLGGLGRWGADLVFSGHGDLRGRAFTVAG